MKIFVAFGYNQRDAWIPELVFPVIEAFGDEVVTGEDEQGENIPDETKERIRSSDALIAFATKRLAEGQQADGNGMMTHRWVTDELTTAITYKLPLVEVREDGVDEQSGLAGRDRQIIRYKESERDKCLVALVKTLGRWHKRNNLTLTVLPDECVQELGPKVRNNPNLRCYYKTLLDFDESEEVKTKIYASKGGLFVLIRDVPRGALIQLRVECGDENWVSNYESTDSYGIYLRRN
jgi:hypothetical protein